jgi:hypothetical protein
MGAPINRYSEHCYYLDYHTSRLGEETSLGNSDYYYS